MSRFRDEKLRGLVPYTPGEQPPDMDRLVKLNTNESPFPPSPRVIEALNSGEAEKLRLYSDPTCRAACAAIAETLGVSSEQVVLTNGSDETLAFLFHAFCPRGAVFPDISYGFYPVFSEMFGVRATTIPLREDFSIDVRDYEGCSGTVVIANPNAPTGLCLGPDQIEALLRQDRDRLVVVDEAYIDFGGETALPLLAKYDNLCIIRTFSKSRQLAGARLGFAVAGRELAAELNDVRFSFNPYNVNRLSLVAAEASMRDTDYFERCRAAVIKNRGLLTGGLRELGFTVLPSAANFVFAGAPERVTGGNFYRGLRERGVLVRWFDKDRIRDYTRITVGTAEQVAVLLRAAEDVLKNSPKKER